MNNMPKNLFIAAVCIIVAIGFWKQNNERKASTSWPSTTGIVLKSYVKQVTEPIRDNDNQYRYSRTYYALVVDYKFQVDGISYKGFRIKIGGKKYNTEAEASRDLENYKAGNTVPVYYNPGNPKANVVNPG